MKFIFDLAVSIAADPVCSKTEIISCVVWVKIWVWPNARRPLAEKYDALFLDLTELSLDFVAIKPQRSSEDHWPLCLWLLFGPAQLPKEAKTAATMPFLPKYLRRKASNACVLLIAWVSVWA